VHKEFLFGISLTSMDHEDLMTDDMESV